MRDAMRQVAEVAVRRRLVILGTLAAVTLASVVTVLVRARDAAEHEAAWLRHRLAERRSLVTRLQTDLVLVAKATERVSQLASIARDRNMEVRRLARLDGTGEGTYTPALMIGTDATIGRSEDAARALAQLGFLEDEMAATADSLALMTSLVKPEASRPAAKRAKRAAVRTPRAAGFLVGLPVRGEITSGFGMRTSPYGRGRKPHTGIDIRAGYGTPVAASGAGVVVFAGRDSGGYGSTVVVDHGGDMKTLYGHLSAIYIRKGQRVARGTPIGAVGATGRARGVHLHYEVRVGEVPVDPIGYARGRAPALTSEEPEAIRAVARLVPSRIVGP